MTILHLGPSSPHIEHVKAVFSRFAPEVRHVHGDLSAQWDAGVCFIHNLTDHPFELSALAASKGMRVVGWVWNDVWMQRDPGEFSRTLQAMDACALVVGDAESEARKHVLPEKWHPIRPMPWASVFHPPAPGAVRDIPVLVARGWNGHPLYWAAETKEALRGMEGVVYVDGKRTPGEMADLYRRSRCVVALREDAGPSYTVVEAALCGAIPVVSDTPANRKHLDWESGDWMGALFAQRRPERIRYCVELALEEEPSPAFAPERNARYFASWTAEFQGPALVRRVLEVADGSR